MKESAFRSFYKKLAIEGVLKSVMLSSVFSLFIVFITSAVLWFYNVNALWIAIAIYVGVTAALSVLFYFRMFRPTTTSMAKRIDALGLEERILTMSELENDDSYIAMKQREDAIWALNKVNAKEIKFGFRTSLIVVLCVSFCLSCGMTTVNVLGATGKIPDGGDLIDGIVNPNERYYTVKYIPIDYETYVIRKKLIETENGMIDGNEEQIIAKGESGETVIATADPDYMFYGWSGSTEGVERREVGVVVDNSMFDEKKKVAFVYEDKLIDSYFYEPNGWALVKSPDTGEITIYVFAFIGPVGEGEGEGGGEDGDAPNEDGEQIPSEDNPEGGDKNESGDKDQSDKDTDGDTGGDHGGKSDKDNDKIIDGSQDYHERKDEYVQEYEKRKASGEEIPDWLQKIVDDYYKLLN